MGKWIWSEQSKSAWSHEQQPTDVTAFYASLAIGCLNRIATSLERLAAGASLAERERANAKGAAQYAAAIAAESAAEDRFKPVVDAAADLPADDQRAIFTVQSAAGWQFRRGTTPENLSERLREVAGIDPWRVDPVSFDGIGKVKAEAWRKALAKLPVPATA